MNYDAWKTTTDLDAFPDLGDEDICCEECLRGLPCAGRTPDAAPLPAERLRPEDFGLDLSANSREADALPF